MKKVDDNYNDHQFYDKKSKLDASNHNDLSL